MKNVLITGGAGFIGSRLALKLLDKGYFVRVIDILSTQIHGQNPELSSLYLSIKDKVDFIRGSVTDKNIMRKALIGIDTVIHYAAETGTGQSMYEIEKYVDVNVLGSAILLDIIGNEETSVKKIIVASSRAIYGEGSYSCKNHNVVYPISRNEQKMISGDFNIYCPKCNEVVQMIPTSESSLVSPSSIYGITKYNQEQMFLVFGRSKNISAIAFRYQNVYGEGQSLVNPYTGILSIFSTRIRNNNSITIFEDGNESRDFVHVDDVVRATILGLEDPRIIQEVFNVGAGEAISVSSLANMLCNLFNKDVPIIISGNFRLGDIRHNLADLTHISNSLGYFPTIKFKDGLERFVKWVMTEQISTDNYDNSIKELKDKGLFK